MAKDPKFESKQLVQIRPSGEAKKPLELEAVRERLSAARGPRYWRSLEELTQDPAFEELMEREFPRHAAEFTDPVSRRGFLKLMSASMALAGLTACTKQPPEDIVPYVQQPEDLIPGKPMYFASARPTNFGAQPLLVKSHMFRPIKVDGNPDHPYSQGASDVYTQASILELYDPDRSQYVSYNGAMKTWGDFVGEIRNLAGAEKLGKGAGIRFLTETVISPSLADLMRKVLQSYPAAKWYQYDAVNRDNARAGSRMALGQYLEPVYKLENADVIVSLDADFLGGGYYPGFVQLAREFAKKRRLDGEKPEMNRLYVVESQTTTTGGKADHRLPMRAWEVAQFAFALANELGAGGAALPDKAGDKAKRFLAAVAKDLKDTRGRCVVIPGEQQSAEVHALALAINGALGNLGKSVVLTDTVEIAPTEQTAGLKELVADMNAGKVTGLLMLGGNPAYNAPADMDFKAVMSKVPMRAHLSPDRDDTSQHCHWHVPMAHYLESWGDARVYDGSVALQQPLIDPFYGGKTAYDVLMLFTDSPGTAHFDAIKAYWQAQSKKTGAEFEKWWHKSVHDGFVESTPAAAKNVTPKVSGLTAPKGDETIEIVFRPDPNIFDGRFNNNGWLQELPKPVTKLTWDNAVLVSKQTAQTKGLTSQDLVTLKLGGKTVDAPIYITPGFPDGTVTVYLGYGRGHTGRVGSRVGFNSYKLRTTAGMDSARGLTWDRQDGKQLKLAVTQHIIDTHKPLLKDDFSVTEVGDEAAERELIHSFTLEEFAHDEKIREELKPEFDEKTTSLFGENGHTNWVDDPAKASNQHQWAMAIDMSACVGCQACVAACNAENNIPIVGKEQVMRGRAMHWIRIDTYYESVGGDAANPRAFFQPLPCQQCENAPCEPVCPVGATVHSPEGLNNMVYNRCVGTRYCSNNCPYKVRRFNWLLFQDYETESLMGLRNPDVSVRSRGVMEKCTYCVQRINAAKITAEKRMGQTAPDGSVYDGSVRDDDGLETACQQACPTDAIMFGNLLEKKSKVNQWKARRNNYLLLADVNTRPRTSYLANVRNPNPELEEKTETKTHVG